MTFTFLGTGTSGGVPMIACSCRVCTSENPRDKRLRSSLMIENDSTRIVIDTGPDFRQQMLSENVKTLDAVVFTHEHKDHISGLDDVRAFNYVQNKAMDVFATLRVQEALRREFHYVFSGEVYPGIPKLELHTIDTKPFSAASINFIPVPVLHLKAPVLGFRMGDFSYITDANFIDEKSKDLIRNSKVLVLNALRKEKHISHFNLEEAVSLVEELKPEKAYFTHISHQLGLHDEVNKELPAHIRCAYDGLKISIG
jgi:phosphoribosyl 1,2-cyclic phosphate phosphodiesterase